VSRRSAWPLIWSLDWAGRSLAIYAITRCLQASIPYHHFTGDRTLQFLACLDESADETIVDCLLGGQPMISFNVL